MLRDSGILGHLFSTDGFIPRRVCGLWPDWLVWEHVTGNALVWTAYIAIPVLIWRLGAKRPELARFSGLVRAFACFVLLCGLGHFLDMLAYFRPMYRLSGHVLIATGAASWWTAWAIRRAWPAIIGMKTRPQFERDIAERTAALAGTNDALVAEVAVRSRAEAALVRERDFLQAILENLSDGVVACDAEGVLTHSNRATQELHGLPAEPIPAEKWSGYYGLYRADGSTPMPMEEIPLYRSLRGETVRDIELIISRIGGAPRSVLVSGRPLFDARGAKQGAVVVMHDVTERKRAEAARDRLVALLEATPDFVAIADKRGRILYMNRGGRRMVGLGEEVIEQTSIPGYHPAWANELFGTVGLPTILSEGVWSGETALLRRDGSEVPVSQVVVAHKDVQGDVEFLSTVARDITDRNRAEQEIRSLNTQLERRLNRLTALRQIDMVITTSHDLGVILSTLLDQITSRLGVDAVDVLLLDTQAHTLRYAAGRGFVGDRITRTTLRLGEGLAGRAALEHHLVNVPDLREGGGDFVRASLLAGEGFVAYYGMPLVVHGQVKGVLEVFHRGPLAPDPEWLEFLEALAGQAAIAIDSATLFEALQLKNDELTLAYDATIEGWSRAMDLRDKDTEGHTRRVTELALRLARAMGMSEDELVHVRRGALLHDIGKMGVPDGILLKPGPLTDEEWVVMRRHPGYAHEWLSPIPYLSRALDIPYGHHEKWDGTGYPRGLKGEQIPLAARVFAAVDIWDALRSDRPYRKGWPEEKIRAHIQCLAGTHLDAEVVEAFLSITFPGAEEQADPLPSTRSGTIMTSLSC